MRTTITIYEFFGGRTQRQIDPQNFLVALPAYDGEIFFKGLPAEMNEMGAINGMICERDAEEKSRPSP